MRTLKKNQQSMYYANQKKEKEPIYDYYEDSDGNKYPVDTGEFKYFYDLPEEFAGNIAMAGGESEALQYGVSLGDYSAVLVVSKELLPLKETSRIWFENPPVYLMDGHVDEFSADYQVKKSVPSINGQTYLLDKVVK